jgi:hypothetical protein
MNLRRLKKRMSLNFVRFSRIATGRSSEIKHRRSKNERMIIRIVRSVINVPDSRVYYSPKSSRFFLHTKDRRYIISMDSESIRITNHHFFFNSDLRSSVSDELMGLAFSRIEEDMIKLESASIFNENIFLNEVYSSIKENSEIMVGMPVEE